MATYLFNGFGIVADLPFDPNADVIDFSGSGLSAAQLFLGGDSDDDVALLTSTRVLFLLIDEPGRLHQGNFVNLAGGSQVLIGDNTSAWRDDDLAQTINGSAGDDLIAGLGGNDLINAGGGNDFIYSFLGANGSLGSDTIDGGAGIDTLDLSDEPDGLEGFVLDANLATGLVSMGTDGTLVVSNIENLFGSSLSDRLTGNAVANFLGGDHGHDTIAGGDGNDTLAGHEGNDSLSGGGGNDLLMGGADPDTLDGGSGDDIYHGVRGGDTIVEAPGGGVDTLRDALFLNLGAFAEVENIVLLGSAPVGATGNALANRITGNAGDNFLEGGAGNDTLDGGGQDFTDLANYQASASAIVATFSGPGSATVSIGAETDTLINMEGIYGGNGNDTITGGSGNDRLRGNGGADSLDGGGGFDTLSLLNANVQVRVNLGTTAATVNGQLLAANSALDSFGSTDTVLNVEGVLGGTGNDILVGSSANDRIEGYAGNDTLVGGAGNDTLDGHLSHTKPPPGIGALDTLGDEVQYRDAQQGVSVNLGTGIAIDGTDTDLSDLPVQAGIDTLISIEGVVGSAFADSLVGGNPSHIVIGSSPRDSDEFFEGGAGDDTIDGGDHNGAAADHGYFDTVIYRNDPAGVIVNLGVGDVTVNGVTVAGGSARDGFGNTDTLRNIDKAIGSSFADYLRGGSTSAGLGGDLFEAFAGGAGNDTIDGGGGSDRADYNVFGANAVHVQIDESTGNGTAFNDGFGNTDTLIGIERVRGSTSSTGDTLTGGTGNEGFEGRQGNDLIDGGAGNDRAFYTNTNSGVIVNLSESAVSTFAGVLAANSAFDGFGFTDSLTSIERATGGDFDDTFFGQAGEQNLFDGRHGVRVNPATGSIGVHFDTADYSSHGNAINVNLVTGLVADGGGGTDTLTNIERVIGSAGNDTLLGSNLALEYAGLFADRFQVFRGGAGNDSINGGSAAWGDFDQVEYQSSTSGVNVNLGTGLVADGSGGTDTLTNIDGVIGSQHNDTLTGGSDSRIFGGTSFEVFTGLGGNDLIQGATGFGQDRSFDMASYQGASGGGIIANLGFQQVTVNGVTVNGQTVNAEAVGHGIDQVLFIEGVRGGQGNDSLFGADFNGFGRELFEGNGGFDYIDGNGDYDIVSYRSAPTSVYVHLGYGFALDGWNATDTFVEVEGASGGDFDDTLVGGSLMDDGDVDWEEFEGRAGNDLIDGGDDFDDGELVDLGLDLDAAAYRNAPSAVNVNLATGIAQDGHGDTDTLVGIELAYGSRFDDTLTGGNAAHDGFEGFEGRGGNDLITGGSGSDFVLYEESPGAVSVNLATGSATDGWILPGAGAAGTDTLSGIENVSGSRFDDVLIGTAGVNFLFGNEGSDTLTGGAGNDDLNGEEDFNGRDRDFADYGGATTGAIVDLAAGKASDGQGGNDLMWGIEGAFGGSFADRFTGDAEDNFFMGRAGNDTLDGGAGGDWAWYRNDAAAVSVNLGTGTATDGAGNTDTLISIEHARGSAHNDTLIGSSGNNHFQGGAGNDFIDAGAGTRDRAVYSDASGAVTITGGGAAGEGRYTVTGASGTDTLVGIEQIDGSEFADTITGRVLGASEREFIRGGGGNDTIIGGASGLTMLSFRNEDVGIFINLSQAGGSGRNDDGFLNVFEPTGNRTITYRNIEGLFGGNFNDFVIGSGVNDYLQGGNGSDIFQAGAGFDAAVYTISPNPILVNFTGAVLFATYFDADGNNHGTIQLQNGQVADGFRQGGGDFAPLSIDTLTEVEWVQGGEFNDSMFGGAAGERFDGRDGSDAFFGSGGSDTFNGDEGMDRVFYGSNSVAVRVDLAAGTAQKGITGTDTLQSVENVSGSNFDDTLTGSDTQPYTGTMRDLAEFYFGGAGNDSIDGADSIGGSPDGQFDIVGYDGFGVSSGVIVDLGLGTASGGGGNDTLANIDAVIGTGFADSLTGGSQSRSFPGFFFEQFSGRGGNDTIDGLFGEDRVDYSNAGAPVNVTLGNGTLPGSAADGQGGVDLLRNIEGVRGSNFSDVLTGGGTHNAGTVYDLETFEGMEGNDTINGLGGFDQASYQRSTGAVTVSLATGIAFDGFGTRDTLTGIEGVVGSDFNDSLTGSNNPAGSVEQFRAMAGNDTIDGGGGFDRAAYHGAPSAVNANLATGIAQDGHGTTDTLIAVEGLRGSVFNDTLTGSGGDNTFEGWKGDDNIQGGGGFDRVEYVRDEAGVFVDLELGTSTSSFSGIDTLSSIEAVRGSEFADDLEGDAADNVLDGGAGDDVLDGRGGADTLIGGAGDDYYVTDVEFVGAPSLEDTVIESLNQGTDTIVVLGPVGVDDLPLPSPAPFTYVMAANFETLFLYDNGNSNPDDALWQFNGTGNTSANLIVGNGASNTLLGEGGNDTLFGHGGADTLEGGIGADMLDGGGGADRMRGGASNDTYVVDDAGDLPTELLNEGTDLVQASVTHTLGTNVENLTLIGLAVINGTGNGLNNRLIGNNAANVLDGGTGNDSMFGWEGDDTYIVDSLGDVVGEGAPPGGIDTVRSSVTFSLAAIGNIEHLTLTGAAAIDGTGNNLANTILGNNAINTLNGDNGNDSLAGFGGNDVLNGDVGNDTLNGGAGDDAMTGGAGNDIYIVNAVGDVVTELTLGGTADQVTSSINYVLDAEVEKLVLSGTATHGTGNELANTLTGNALANVLDGGVGVDTMAGVAGDDTYQVDNSLDRVNETLNNGVDTVISSVTHALRVNVENLTLTGSANLNGTGNSHANAIVGNDGSNILRGTTGNDILTGGGGIDNFDFREAPGAANADAITDFVSGTDRIRLDDAFHAGIGALGRFGATDVRFLAGDGATVGTTLDHRVIFNTADGSLYYDFDGSGAGASQLITTVGGTSTPILVANDIFVI